MSRLTSQDMGSHEEEGEEICSTSSVVVGPEGRQRGCRGRETQEEEPADCGHPFMTGLGPEKREEVRVP